LQQLQEEYGEDQLVCLYYHVSDIYETPETNARADYFAVSGIPETDFDAVDEIVGAGSNAYNTFKPRVLTRMADPTPITMSTTGVIRPAGDPDPSWVEATFRVVDTVPPDYGTLRAQFVVYEDIGDSYPWTVRDMLPVEYISTLTTPGDSVVVYKEFTVDGSWNYGELHMAVFLEDTSPRLVINSQIMPDPYNNRFVHTDRKATEIDVFGEAMYHTFIENSGVFPDTITVSFQHVELPDGIGTFDWAAFYCDSSGTCYFGPHDYVLAPGESESLEVHVLDSVGHTTGMAVSELTAVNANDPLSISTVLFTTFVGEPSILVVDDDGGAAFESYLETALTDTGYVFQSWDTAARGRVDLVELTSYWAVLWTTANDEGLGLDVDDENKLVEYLDGGGNLMLASMNYLSGRVDTSAFITDYLHIDSWVNDNGGFVMTGVASDPISDGMSLPLFGGPFQPGGSDAMVVSSPAEVIFTSPPGDKGIKVEENGHKVVFLGFPFECVSTTNPDPNNEASLVARVLDWFQTTSGAEEGEIHRLALEQNHPNPFNPVTTVAFTVPEGAGKVTLTVHNVNGQVVSTLVDEKLPAGPAIAVWDGTDAAGRSVASGVYFAKLAAGNESAFRKMTLLK
jgi:hypothetical protein